MIVTQTWTHNLTLMQQTVLLTAVRGPDGVAKYHPCKFMLRWFRRCTLLNSLTKQVMATPYELGGGSFTGPSYDARVIEPGIGVTISAHDWTERMNAIVHDYLRALDELPHHFQLHFMHAAEIVGYKHPDVVTRDWWNWLYRELARDMHLSPETEEEMDFRLGDDEAQWRSSNHEATQA